MKKWVLGVLLLCFSASGALAAYTSDVKILEKKEITKLSDDDLVDQYLDTIAEVEANRSYHTTSGFSPKDFKDFKALIKFRLLLLMEIHSRNLEIPQLER